MIPEVGATCLFTFTSKFATLNGVYTITLEMTFANAVATGVDFLKNLYTPAGLGQADFNADWNSYAEDRVAVLTSVVDNTVVYYAPESIFLKVPDPTIKEYYPLIMVVDLGVQQNTQAVTPLLGTIKDTVQAALGSTNPVKVVTNPQKKVYLTDAQYAAVVAARETQIGTLVPLTVQLQEAQNKINFQAAQIAAYETLIASLA